MIKKYTVVEFRKNVREAFNVIDEGGQVFISRHGVRYEVKKADIQSGKKQFEEPRKMEAEPVYTPPLINGEPLISSNVKKFNKGFDMSFPDNGDARAQVESPDSLPTDNFDLTSAFDSGAKKNIAEGKPSELDNIKAELEQKQKELDAINIDTQDPDEVERGSQLAADIDTLKTTIASFGAGRA